MAQQRINVGSGEYSGDGESLRSAFTKTNTNFDEVYTSINDINANITDILSTSTTDQLVNGDHHLVLDTNGNLTFPQGTILGNTELGGFIIDGAVDKDIEIYTYSGDDAHGWTFDTSGNLTLPSTNTITAAFSQQVGTIVWGIESWNWHSGTGDPYSWNPSINPVFDSLYNIGPRIIGWTFYSIGNPMDAVTITSYGDRSLGFSDDLGSGPYAAQSPDYVQFHGNPVVIQTNGPQFQANWTFGADGKLTTPGNVEVDGGRVTLHPYGNAYIESVDYGITTSTSALNIFAGPDQKIKLRAGFGLEAFWTFDQNGNLTLPVGGQIINLDIDGGDSSV